MPTFFDPVTGTVVQDYGPGGLSEQQPMQPDLAPFDANLAPFAPTTGAELIAPQPPPAPAPMSVSQGMSVSESGFSPEKGAQVAAFTDPKVSKDEKVLQSQAQAQEAKQSGLVTDAAQGKMAAQDQATAAQADVIGAKSAGEAALGVLNQQFVQEEQDAMAMAKASTDKAKADYLAQVQKVGAMRVDPSRLMKNAGWGGRLGLGLSAFAEGFLGAKGIRISAIENIKSAIQDDINAQLTDIQQGRETTADFRMLYDMARQETSDVAQMRQRLQGFYLEAAKHAIAADTLKYEGKLALAQGEQAIAAIVEEQNKSLAAISQHSYDQYLKALNDVRDYRLGQGQLSLQRRSVAAQETANTLAAQAAEAKRVAQIEVVDTETGGSLGLARSEADRQKIQDRINDTTSASREASELIALMAKTDIPTIRAKLTYGRALSADEQKIMSKAKNIWVALAKANNPDGRISDHDLEAAKGMIELEESLRAGDPSAAVAQLFSDKIKGVRDNVLGSTYQPSAQEAQYLRGGNLAAKRTIEAREKELADRAAQKQAEATRESKIGAEYSRPSDRKSPIDQAVPAKDVSDLSQKLWYNYSATHEGETVRMMPEVGPGFDVPEIDKPTNVPRYAENIGKLLTTALNSTDQKDRAEAKETLDLIQNDPNIPADIRDYATWAVGKSGLSKRFAREYQE